MERRQPIVIGINEKGEMLWSDMEMPLWQRKLFPIRYTGDFSAFWQKLTLLQAMDIEYESPNFAGFHAYVPAAVSKKYGKRNHHKGD